MGLTRDLQSGKIVAFVQDPVGIWSMRHGPGTGKCRVVLVCMRVYLKVRRTMKYYGGRRKYWTWKWKGTSIKGTGAQILRDMTKHT